MPFPWKKPVLFGKTLDQVISLFGFIDHGEVFILDERIGEKGESLTGLGGGIRVNIPAASPYFPTTSVSIQYGIPMGGPTPSDDSDGIFYIGGRLLY